MESPAAPLQQLQSAAAPAGGGHDAPGDEHAWLRGELVRVRGGRWRIEDSRPFPDCRLIALAGIGSSNRGRRLALLSPFDRPQRLERCARLRRIGRRRWLRAFGALVAGATPFGRLRTVAAAGIDLHRYQLEPALAVLNGLATRLLLADEVGLGKTIQAGIIVSELQSRDASARMLILTPAGLRDQWASELRDRFSIDAAVVDAATIRRTTRQIAAGTNPWSVWPVAIASLDFVKRPEVLRALDPFTWEAVLVDEAHTCALAPERSAAVQRLAARARHVVLLTATPHAGDDQAFAALCAVGKATNDDVVMFRRARPDVGLVRNRRVHLFHVHCTEQERRMHRLLERYTAAVWASPEVSADARLAMIVLRKRALSSATSLTRSVERRLDALFGDGAAAVQFALPFAGSAEPDDQTPEDDESIRCLGVPAMGGRRERDWLRRVLDAARRAAASESKLARLSRLLARAREPAVIFTEYRDTARWLASTLAPVGRVVLLHGAMSRAERLEAERRFRSGDADLLVATDAAGEGLNLQQRCRLVVNLELPWNPMRLEQRIGRVDRLGQRRRPHAIHLVAAGTGEERIVGRLVFRQARARQAVGYVTDAIGAPREEDVARAVMSDAIDSITSGHPRARGSDAQAEDATAPIQPPAFATLDLRAMAADEVRRLTAVRALTPRSHPKRSLSTRLTPASGDAFAVPSLAILPRRRARRDAVSGGATCVFVVRLLDAREGEVLDESLVVLQFDRSTIPPPVNLDPAALRRLVHCDALRDRALSVAAGRLEAAATLQRRAAVAARAREEALAAAERGDGVPLQPGMFDTRAVRQAEREQAGRAARASEEAERLARLDRRASSDPVAQAELALVLWVDS